MPMLRRVLALFSLVGMTACPDAPSYDDLPGLTSSGTTGDDGSTPTSSAPDGNGEASTDDAPGPTGTTSTTSAAEDGATTFAEETATVPMDGPPTIDLLPLNIDAAGPLKLEVVLSADVTEYELFQGEVSLGKFAPEDPTFEFAVTSQIQCQTAGEFRAVAHDGEMFAAEDTETVGCSLPASGSEALNQKLPGQTASFVHAVAVLGDGFVAAGEMDGRMALWRLGPDLEVLSGWPRTLGDWTGIAGLGALQSSATALVIDGAQDNIIVAGNVVKNGERSYYVARLTDTGSRIGEAQGMAKEEAAGVAVTPDGVVVVAGAVKTSDGPTTFDWRVWGYPELTETKVAPWSDTLPLGPGEQPDEMNVRSERARAAAVLPNGEILVAGEREFRAKLKDTFTRASWQRYTSKGGRVGSLFTSTKDSDSHDAANAVVVLPGDEFAITGWMRKNIGDAPKMLSWHFEGGVPMEYKIEPGVNAEGKGIARDRVGNLIVAAVLTANGQFDAWAFAISDWSGGKHWDTPPHGSPDAWDAYDAVACNEWGYCLTGGFLTVNGVFTGFLRLHNP